jgi:integrase
MAYVYERKKSPFLYIRWKDASGAWTPGEPTKFRKDSEADRLEAEKLCRALERKVKAEELASGGTGKPTNLKYLDRWLAARRTAGKWTVDDEETRLRKHVMPHIGHLLVEQTSRADLVACFKAIMAAGKLAPRSILNAYGMVHRFYEDAIADGLITTSPATLDVSRGELPVKKDKNPLWRATAIYSRAEVEALLSDPRIPPIRRVLYALMFLGGGKRAGETSDRRFGDIDHSAEPLPRMTVGTSWNSKKQVRKETKTGRVRYVPVHPVLSRILAEWKLSGWEAHFGRTPTNDDLIVPARPWGDRTELRQRHSTKIWEDLRKDCTTLGFRLRRTHDIRRTFTTLMQVDGAAPGVVKLITHGPEGDIVSDYTTLPWTTMCQAVAGLKIDVRRGELIALPKAVGAPELVTPCDSGTLETKKTPESEDLGAFDGVPRAGFEEARAVSQGAPSGLNYSNPGERVRTTSPGLPPDCRTDVTAERGDDDDLGGYIARAHELGFDVTVGGNLIPMRGGGR